MRTQPYNGWRNYYTWNAALWLMNDEYLYNLIHEWYQWRLIHKRGRVLTYNCFINYAFCGVTAEDKTGDGVSWNDPRISRIEMRRVLEEVCRG